MTDKKYLLEPFQSKSLKMDQELEMAQVYMEAKNYESAFNILHPLGNRKFWDYNFNLGMISNLYITY